MLEMSGADAVRISNADQKNLLVEMTVRKTGAGEIKLGVLVPRDASATLLQLEERAMLKAAELLTKMAKSFRG